jgi:uncharacterized membrane protein YidH (DUF202 family)
MPWLRTAVALVVTILGASVWATTCVAHTPLTTNRDLVTIIVLGALICVPSLFAIMTAIVRRERRVLDAPISSATSWPE